MVGVERAVSTQLTTGAPAFVLTEASGSLASPTQYLLQPASGDVDPLPRSRWGDADA